MSGHCSESGETICGRTDFRFHGNRFEPGCFVIRFDQRATGSIWTGSRFIGGAPLGETDDA